MPEGREEFYVGYEPQAPPGLVRHRRRTVLALLLAAPVVAALAAGFQGPFADAVFEYGQPRSFEGRLIEGPYPALEVERPAEHAGETHLLVARGKRGAAALVAGLDGHAVALEGQLIYRGDAKMIEIGAGGVLDRGPAGERRPGGRSLGEQRLAGEIVDGKCYLGVMKPGAGKPHRACAARCISGGAPAMLRAEDRGGETALYLLVGRDGRPLGPELLPWVAEPVAVAGEVVRSGRLWQLRTEPRDITRLAPR